MLLTLLMGALAGCTSQKETAEMHHPPIPGKPPKIPAEPAIVETMLLPESDRDQEKIKKRKETRPTPQKGQKTNGAKRERKRRW